MGIIRFPGERAVAMSLTSCNLSGAFARLRSCVVRSHSELNASVRVCMRVSVSLSAGLLVVIGIGVALGVAVGVFILFALILCHKR